MTRRPRGRPRHPDVLTPAEWSVLDMLRHGMSRRQIAERRGVSLDAVKYHVENIGGKLGVSGVAALRHWPGYPASSPMTRRNVRMPTNDLALGPIGQVSLLARDIARVETFYRDTLGLPHVFTFGDLAFFDASGTRLYSGRYPREWR
jgi:DNA-binding CsgD family transcriptional regulator